MDLPNLLNKLKTTPEEPKKFIAIEIGFDSVKTAIWQSTGIHTEVVSTGSVQTWDPSTPDDLITAIDTSLADAQASVSEEPEQVIFGLPETWVDGDGIAEAKKTTLKNICQKLGLKAIGFVVSPEAMIHHLRDVEGGPPSAILVQVAVSEIAVSLIYLGKLQSTQMVGRSTAVATDVEEALARIPSNGHLPSRMILLSDTEDSESLKQELISYEWQKKLEFLHFPKIESLPKDWSIKAIAIAGGAEVVESLGFSNIVQHPKTDIKSETIQPLEPDIKAEASAFGFESVNLSQAEMPLKDHETNLEETVEDIENVEPAVEIEPKAPVTRQKTFKPQKLLLKFGNRLKNIFTKKSDNAQISSKSKDTKAWIIPIVILVTIVSLVGGVGFAYTKYPQASIDVLVNLNPYQQQLTFTVDPTMSAGSEGLVVAGTKQAIDQSGTKTVPTTGTKTVGERAKGKVAIYNRTTASKTLSAGTVIKANTARFTLDAAVTIASASTKENTDFSVTTEPAKAEVMVTAADIGDQYNLPKDTQFSVANFSNESFIAVAQTGLTGGTARKVAAVAKEDQENIKKALIEELQTQIEQSMQDSSQDTAKIVVGEPEITIENYSAKTGDEAASVTLELTLTQSVYQYNLAEVSLLAQQAASNSLPANVQLKPNSTKINILTTTIDENDRAQVNAQVVLQYIPRIEANDYIGELVGVPLSEVDKKLSSMPNYQSHTIESKWLMFGRLPLTKDQITLHIKPVSKTE